MTRPPSLERNSKTELSVSDSGVTVPVALTISPSNDVTIVEGRGVLVRRFLE
jgi:hypothetical protein